MYSGEKTYNVVSKDSVANIDGVEIQFIDYIGKTLQSPIEYLVLKPSAIKFLDTNSRLFKDFLERNYTTYAPLQRNKLRHVNYDR